MTLTELRTEVALLTNRDDLNVSNHILSAVQAATLKAHHLDYFYKDIYEVGVEFPSPTLTLQQIEYQTLIPRWRALKYLRKVENSTPTTFFDIVLPETVIDSYSINRKNVCYVAGTILQIRSSTALARALLGCYLNPVLTPASYTSWIAVDHPYAIIYDAAATVFKMIGKTDEFAAYRGLRDEQFMLLRQSEILAQGY